MKIRGSIVAALAVLLTACGDQVLNVGDGAGEGGVPEPTGDGGALECAPGACANYSFTCTEGSPTNVHCVVDTSPQFSSPICALTGQCSSVSAVPTCSWAATPCSGSEACSAPAGAGGVVSVEVDPAATGGPSQTVLSAYFNFGEDVGGQALGACVYNPYGNQLVQSGFVGAPAPRPGIVTVTAPGFTESAVPACDGTYAPVTTSEPIAPGTLVSFAWSAQGTAGSGTDFPTSLPSVPAPHFVALATSDALAAASPSVPRGNDLAVDWTATGKPLQLEQVVVILTQGLAVMTCTFDASAGSGVVPADALLELDAGSAAYEVYSLHEADDGTEGNGGYLRFLVEMAATTPAGLAKGTLTLE
jgi:hypothetical protein